MRRYLAHYIGRSDHAWQVRPEAAACLRPPSEYLSQVWFDTVLFDHASTLALIDRVGADRVIFGTDYPFDMGDYDLGPLARNLGDTRSAAVLGNGTAALFGVYQSAADRSGFNRDSFRRQFIPGVFSFREPGAPETMPKDIGAIEACGCTQS